MPLRYATREPPLAAASVATSALAASVQKPALLLLLHGTGDNEHGLLPIVDALPAGSAARRFRVASLRAPLSAPYGGFRWFEGYSAAPEPQALRQSIADSCDQLFGFIESAPDKLGTAPDRVYLLGFSQGATMGWTAMLSRWPRPRFIKGAMLLSGRLMPQLLGPPGTPLSARLAEPSQLDGVPIFAAHGARDLVTPASIGRENPERLRSWLGRGASCEYVEDAKGGHDISPSTLSALGRWLDRLEPGG